MDNLIKVYTADINKDIEYLQDTFNNILSNSDNIEINPSFEFNDVEYKSTHDLISNIFNKEIDYPLLENSIPLLNDLLPDLINSLSEIRKRIDHFNTEPGENSLQTIVDESVIIREDFPNLSIVDFYYKLESNLNAAGFIYPSYFLEKPDLYNAIFQEEEEDIPVLDVPSVAINDDYDVDVDDFNIVSNVNDSDLTESDVNDTSPDETRVSISDISLDSILEDIDFNEAIIPIESALSNSTELVEEITDDIPILSDYVDKAESDIPEINSTSILDMFDNISNVSNIDEYITSNVNSVEDTDNIFNNIINKSSEIFESSDVLNMATNMSDVLVDKSTSSKKSESILNNPINYVDYIKSFVDNSSNEESTEMNSSSFDKHETVKHDMPEYIEADIKVEDNKAPDVDELIESDSDNTKIIKEELAKDEALTKNESNNSSSTTNINETSNVNSSNIDFSEVINRLRKIENKLTGTLDVHIID